MSAHRSWYRSDRLTWRTYNAGKGGSTVADLRARSNVKAGVSKAVPGVQDRILTISGSLEDVSAVRWAVFAVL